MQNPSSILITGASSGIGAALAKAYASKDINLFLTARSKKRIEEIKLFCQNKGAKVNILICDICDEGKITAWIEKCDNEKPIDLVIANAGISAGTSGQNESSEQVKNIFSTNINGVLNTIQPLIDRMTKRKNGQIAIMSSLAGYRGLPSSPAYSASKAAVRVYGEALRGTVAKNNVKVTVITPGYIKTPMTDVNKFPMPFLVEVDDAANLIKRKLQKNPARIAFPFIMYFVIYLLTFLPCWLTDSIFSRLPAKDSFEKQGDT
ncbi:SDR family NAD(P)-dependent oxidoreductase [Rickettsiales bacterium]|nr:SDR family NAD(P)-dependent oxidoreductase [Rickettsiales bacterium]